MSVRSASTHINPGLPANAANCPAAPAAPDSETMSNSSRPANAASSPGGSAQPSSIRRSQPPRPASAASAPGSSVHASSHSSGPRWTAANRRAWATPTRARLTATRVIPGIHDNRASAAVSGSGARGSARSHGPGQLIATATGVSQSGDRVGSGARRRRSSGTWCPHST